MGNTNKKEKAKKIAGLIGSILIWIFVGFSALITVLVFSAQGSSDGIPSVFGKSLLTIQTASMEGTYDIGDMVLMTKLTDEEKKRLANFPVGQGLFFAGSNHVHIQIIASETEESLITTNPGRK